MRGCVESCNGPIVATTERVTETPKGNHRKEGTVYVVLILALALVIVISAFWSPIFALIIAVPLFLIFLAYVGFSRRADQEVSTPSGAPVSGEGEGNTGGMWGEKRA